jgi:hypothetical protein
LLIISFLLSLRLSFFSSSSFETDLEVIWDLLELIISLKFSVALFLIVARVPLGEEVVGLE